MDRLLNLLYENARLSNAQIAAMLNVPERDVGTRRSSTLKSAGTKR